jgi:hypothetical protein
VEPFELPEFELPDPESNEPLYLSEVGLYRDIESKQLAPDLIAFAPDHALWTDGAEKKRWMRIPEGAKIDTSDLGDWVFPVGTMAFKEFSRDGRRIETRLIMRTGTGRFDYWMGAFIWNTAESEARFAPDGEENARDTEHDVPEVTKCGSCHNGSRGRYLGFSAAQLARGNGETDLAVIADLLSNAPEDPQALIPPGDETEAEAIGYLHANCGHCHNPSGAAWPDTDLELKFEAGAATPEETKLYQTTIDVALQYFDESEFEVRVSPGEPEASALLFRMTERGTRTQMPTIATELPDPQGISVVRSWIESL